MEVNRPSTKHAIAKQFLGVIFRKSLNNFWGEGKKGIVKKKKVYSQNAVFSFDKGLNCQNHSSPGFHHMVKNPNPAKYSIPLPLRGNLPPLTTIWKTLK